MRLFKPLAILTPESVSTVHVPSATTCDFSKIFKAPNPKPPPGSGANWWPSGSYAQVPTS